METFSDEFPLGTREVQNLEGLHGDYIRDDLGDSICHYHHPCVIARD